MRRKINRIKRGYVIARRKHVRRFKIIGRHPSTLAVATFFVLTFLSIGLYAVAKHTNHLPVSADNRIVIISYDHHERTVPSRQRTVGALLTSLHIPINEGDVVEPALTTAIDQDEFRINIYRAVPVEIIDNGHRNFVFSAATTPRSIVTQAGINLFPEDNVTTSPVENFVTQSSIGEQVIIDRATPVNVDFYGTPVVLRTHAATVAGLIKEKHIHLAKADHVVPDINTPIAAGEQIAFLRTGTKVVTVTEDIPTPVQTINDDSLAYGTSAVRQQGSAGQQVVTYKVQLENNVETGRTVIQKVVTRQPVTQIVVIGTSLSGIKGDMALAGISSNDYQYADYIISHESGWCPTKAQGQYGTCPPYSGFVPSYGGYGLCQSTPGGKMASAGSDWATNPITQLRWCAGYASSRYGSWAAAYNHWINYRNW